MPIPQEAIESGRDASPGWLPDETVEAILQAALPALLSDYRERLVKADLDLRASCGRYDACTDDRLKTKARPSRMLGSRTGAPRERRRRNRRPFRAARTSILSR